jgi:hypothetical protein
MVLLNSICELIELVDKVSDVYTAHWVGLRERHGLREVLPVDVSIVKREWSPLTWTAVQALP